MWLICLLACWTGGDDVTVYCGKDATVYHLQQSCAAYTTGTASTRAAAEKSGLKLCRLCDKAHHAAPAAPAAADHHEAGTRCNAVTLDGTRCSRDATRAGLCTQHAKMEAEKDTNPRPGYCRGVTKKGDPCKNRVKDGAQYCYHHKPT